MLPSYVRRKNRNTSTKSEWGSEWRKGREADGVIR